MKEATLYKKSVAMHYGLGTGVIYTVGQYRTTSN